MNVTIKFDYNEHNVIPYRCRKPRTVRHVGTVDVVIAEVTGDEAPVAFIEPSWTDAAPAEDIRWWNQTPWKQHKPWAQQTEVSLPGSKYFPLEQNTMVSYDSDGYDAAVALVRDQYAEYVVIDGVIWRTTGEPRYVIHTLGLGHNHSCTSLGVDRWYNPNIGRSRYFRADQFEQAKAEAIRLALQRGDTNSVPMINAEQPIQVLIPEAVHCQPEQEAGDGDPFLNRLQGITASADSASTAGLLVLAVGMMAVDAVEPESERP